MPIPRKAGLVAVVVGVLILAACGGGDAPDEEGSSAPDAASTTAAETVDSLPVLRPATGDVGTRAIVAGVVTLPDGFLAIGESVVDDGGGEDIQTVTTFWRSADGRAWTMAEADHAVWGEWTADRVAQGPNGIVVLAGGANGRALATSADGEAWTISPVTAEMAGLAPDAFPGAFPVNDVAAYDGGFLALGQLVGNGAGGTETSPLLLQSTDGVSWARATGPALATTAVLPEYFAGTARLDDDLFAFVTGSHGADVNVWRSSDSATWERVGGPEMFPGADQVVVGAATDFDGQLVAAGHDHTSGATAVWTSTDGRAWEQVPADGLGGQGRLAPELLTSRPGELLMIGTREPAPDGAKAGTVWVSNDGEVWRRQPDDSPVSGRVDVLGVATAGSDVAVVGVRYPSEVDLAAIEFGAWWVEEEPPN